MKQGQLQRLAAIEEDLRALRAGQEASPELLAEVQKVIDYLRESLRREGCDPDGVPPGFEGLSPQEMIDKLREAFPVWDGVVRRPAPASEEAPALPAEEPKPARSLNYRLCCLRLCTVGLGQFSRIFYAGDVWDELTELRAVAEKSEGTQDERYATARVIMKQYKMEPQRGPDWGVLDA